jgi:AsmA protein
VKVIKITGLAVAGVLLLAVLVLLFGIPAQPVMGYIADQAAKDGYQLRVDGSSRISLWPNLNVSADSIRIAEANDAREELFTARQLRIGISLWSLVFGDVHVQDVEVTQPVIRLTSGRSRSSRGTRSDGRDGATRNLAIDRLSVVDGTLIMRDVRENLEGRITSLQLTASAPTQGPLDVKADGKAGGQLLRLAARANSLRQIIDGRPTPVEAKLDLPGLVRGTLSLNANFHATDRVVGIDGVRGTLGQGRVTGSVAIDISGTKPVANANLNFDRVEFESASPARRSGRDEGWSDEPMELRVLRVFDAAVKLSARELVYGGIRVSPAEVEANLSGGLFSLLLSRSDLYGGPVQGRLVVDAAGRDWRYGLNLQFGRVDARQFLSDAVGFGHIEGRYNATFDLTATGESPLAIVSSLGGTADMSFEDGAIRDISIPSIVRTLSNQTLQGWQEKGSERTEFGSFFAKFRVANGKATTDDIRLTGPLVTMTGRGTADLVGRNLDFRVDPKLILSQQGKGSDKDPAGLGVPIVIRGSWSSPQIYPDIAGILDNPEAAFSKLKTMGGSLFGLLDPSGSGGKKPGAEDVIKQFDQLIRGDRDRGERPGSRPQQPERREQVRDIQRDLLGR